MTMETNIGPRLAGSISDYCSCDLHYCRYCVSSILPSRCRRPHSILVESTQWHNTGNSQLISDTLTDVITRMSFFLVCHSNSLNGARKIKGVT